MNKLSDSIIYNKCVNSIPTIFSNSAVRKLLTVNNRIVNNLNIAIQVLLLLILLCTFTGINAQECSHGAYSSPKGHTIYLFFPAADDNTFPEFGGAYGASTSPIPTFDVADLDAGIGTTAQLRDAIFDIVAEDYCEFNVRVVQTTSVPSPTEAQWNIVGIGTDDEGGLFGLAQAVDLNNADAQDYARVWSGSYLSTCGGTGGALSGTNSTLGRWALAIGGTATHEAGHNYGLSHSTTVRPGEDAFTNHIMPAGGNINCATRAGVNRHFSDEDYGILAHNIGLNVMTLYNWDLINPNSQDAYSCELTLLSTQSSLTLSWYYSGNRSPWGSPTITNTGTTQIFESTTYNKFTLTYSTPVAWSGGSNGIVPGGGEFHIGASFNQAGSIIVYEIRLKDTYDNNLSLFPRVPSFDAGSADLASGDFIMRVFNPDPNADALVLQNPQLYFLPRMASIETMMAGDTLRGLNGIPVQLLYPTENYQRFKKLDVKNHSDIRIARFNEERHIDITYDSTGCTRGYYQEEGPADALYGRVEYCPHGTALSLFPSTYVFIEITSVEPNAEYYDRSTSTMVHGSLESKIFYQFAGIVPDFNENGIDDLIDIRDGTSIDENDNGIPDESEQITPPQCKILGISCLWFIIIIILLLIVVILIARFIIRRRP